MNVSLTHAMLHHNEDKPVTNGSLRPPDSSYDTTLPYRLADKGTGAFQYFLKLVPTMHSLWPQLEPEGASPQGGLLAKEGGQGAEQLTSLTTQFTYTYKFRSVKGSTEYHTEHEEGEDKGKDSKRASTMHSMPLPGL